MLADRRTTEESRTLASCPGRRTSRGLPQCFSTEPGSLRVATRLGSSRTASGSSLARGLLGVAAPHAHGRRRASTPPRSGRSARPGRRGRWPARGGSGEDPCPSQTLGCSGVPSQLRERGRLERFRRDKDKFPDSVLGRALDGWPGERWLDIRRIGVRAPIMKARIAKCARKGFDALEPDNIDGYQNKSVSRFPEATSFATTAGSRARRTRRASRLHSRTTSAR
jgi:hypothetical protein